MTDLVNLVVRKEVAILRIVNPPVNTLTRAVRIELMQQLDALERDPSIVALVLCGARQTFISGLPMSELENTQQAPRVAELCARIEDFRKPVVAFVKGHAAGAGLELALAAHARIAEDTALIGFPDLEIGLGPSGGSTQRLPRIVGADGALRLILGHMPHPVTSLICKPLIDQLIKPDERVAAAVRYARLLAQSGDWIRTRDREEGLADSPGFQAAVAQARDRVDPRRQEAEARIIDCIAAAELLPFEVGVGMEQAAFDDMLATARSRGLRRAQSSETRCNRLTGERMPEPGLVAVHPATAANARLTATALLGGLRVVVIDGDRDRLKHCRAEAQRIVTRSMRARLRPAEAVGRAMAQMTFGTETESLPGAQLILLDGPDEARDRRALLDRLAPMIAGDAVVLCPTDHLDCDALAPDALRGRVFGVQIADADYPARLAEIAIGATATEAAIATVQAVLWKMGRKLLRSRLVDGMIGPAMGDALLAAADGLVRGGHDPVRIDAALRRAGFRRGAYDLALRIDGSAYLARSARAGRAEGLSHRLVREQADPTDDAALDRLLGDLAEVCRSRGPQPLPGPQDDAAILSAVNAALANAGAGLLARGTALRPMQIDTAMLQGWGYPRDLGGPMAAADLAGLFAVVRRCKDLAALDPALWTPQPLLLALQRNGQQFAGLDRGQKADVAVA